MTAEIHAPVRLLPMLCIQCGQPVMANPEEIAWVCDTCQRGMLLGDDGSLQPLEVFFSASLAPRAQGRPFWVTQAQVSITERTTYKNDRSREAAEFWSVPRLFFIPAYQAALEDVVSQGMNLLTRPVSINPGPPAPFLPVVTPQDDIHPLAEFIILSLEAGRKDALKTIKFHLNLENPQLWILP